MLGGCPTKKIGCFEGWNQVQIVLWSTHIVRQLLFSLFLTFLGPNGLFLGLMWGSKTVLGSIHGVVFVSLGP